MERQVLAAAAVAALLVASGCTGVDVLADDAETPPDVDVARRYASLDAVEATQVTTLDTGNGTNETRALVRVDLADGYRQYQRVLAPASRAGDVMVVNDSGAMLYDASENAVSLFPRTRGGRGNQSTYLARVVEAARSDDVAELSEGVSPLPVVPASQSGPSIPEEAIDGYEVEYLGTRTVAGRTAYGFELRAVSEAALTVNRTLWLDSEYFYPLASHRRLEYGNRTIETSTRLENVTFDPDLPADAFAFDAPENATVEPTARHTTTYDSVRALRAHVDVPVPDPAVPEDYAFERAYHVGGNTTQVTLQYADANDDRLTVTKLVGAGDETTGFESGERVTVAGRDGQYVTTARTKLVTWTCGADRYSVTATGLDEESLLAVADSVGCA